MPTELNPGTLLSNGTYEIKKILGRGGFGITYLALDVKLEKLVAIKEFFPATLCDRQEDTNHVTVATSGAAQQVEELKSKFIKEARNIAKLSHPNIIRINAAFEENNTAYYVMDYIEGQSLGEMVKRGGPLPADRAKRYIEQIGRALEYLHHNHMTHFDVKPANIMVRKDDDVPVLIDFGLSKNYTVSGEATTTRGPLGISPGYSPVEQYNLTSRPTFSPKSDLYSLAATYYYLLTGIVPPEAMANDASQLSFPAGIDPAVRAALIKGMSMTASGRHESVREFLSRLDAPAPTDDAESTVILNPTPADAPTRMAAPSRPSTPPPSKPYISAPSQPAPKNSGDKKTSGLYIIIALIAILAIGGTVYWFVSREAPNRSNNWVDDIEDADTSRMVYPYVEAVEDEGGIDTFSSEEAPAEVVSPYGPFSSLAQAVGFVESYLTSTCNGDVDTSMLAPHITTDFGTEYTFTRSGFVDQMHDYWTKQRFIGASFELDDPRYIVALSTPDGGVELKFHYMYSLTCYDEYGDPYNRLFDCNSVMKVNSDRQITYFKERNTKVR